jgi:hypothetical protein
MTYTASNAPNLYRWLEDPDGKTYTQISSDTFTAPTTPGNYRVLINAYNPTCDRVCGWNGDWHTTDHCPPESKWQYISSGCGGCVANLTVSPPPTPNPNCTCQDDGTCSTNFCTFDKFDSPITYNNPIKCVLADSLFPSPPTSANKISWCQAGKRTKGDADGNGVVDTTDYFYYVAAVNGGKIPTTVNPDFNGDGEVGAADRAIVIKSLTP